MDAPDIGGFLGIHVSENPAGGVAAVRHGQDAVRRAAYHQEALATPFEEKGLLNAFRPLGQRMIGEANGLPLWPMSPAAISAIASIGLAFLVMALLRQVRGGGQAEGAEDAVPAAAAPFEEPLQPAPAPLDP